MLNEDYKDILLSLSEDGVKYLLVGACAIAAYGYIPQNKILEDDPELLIACIWWPKFRQCFTGYAYEKLLISRTSSI